MTPTPDPKMGDLALTFPFQLAKKLKKAPRMIAQEAAPLLASIDGVVKAEVAGGGFLNLWLDKAAVFAEAVRLGGRTALLPEEGKIIIEHTNINPNKAAHIGHLRNACLGDTLARCLRFKGEKVEVQNYIDDTGVQVVDVVFGFMELEKKTLEDIEGLPGKFDYYCWDLYARVSAYLAGHPEAQARKSAIMKRIEHGQDPEYALSRHVSRRIVQAHLATMGRLGVSYDVLPCESTILHLKFWDTAFELLKERQAIYLASEGENKGCWVMRLEEDEEREKVIVRSDGTVTYVGKDIAYQLWKFGLLGRDFFYEPFAEEDGRTLWISTPAPTAGSPAFGGATQGLQRHRHAPVLSPEGRRPGPALPQVRGPGGQVRPLLLRDGRPVAEEPERARLRRLGRGKGARVPRGLGPQGPRRQGRRPARPARGQGRGRDREAQPRPAPRTSGAGSPGTIATGALRYFMLKFARNSVIVFDFEEALSFEGETGPYLQYTAVRLASIFRKLKERFGVAEADIVPPAGGRPVLPPGLSDQETADFWDLILTGASLEEEVLRSVAALEFSHLAKFAFLLCQKLNGYYHKYPILAEEDLEVRAFRLLVLRTVKDELHRALGLMGIPPPERM